MTNAFKLLGLGCLLLALKVPGCSHAEDEMDRPKMNDVSKLLLMDAVHRQQLQKVQDWLITKGVGEYYKTRDMAPLTEYVKSKGYGWAVNPAIDKYHRHTRTGKLYHDIARLVVQSKYYFIQSWCQEQVEHEGNIYEYWVIHESSQNRSYAFRDCRFLVTQAKGLTGERDVIHSSGQFFSEYQVSPKFTIAYPPENVNQLRVGSYPECFQQTDMPEVKERLSRLNKH